MIVNTGFYKGKAGDIIEVVDAERVVVEGINVVFKHVKPSRLHPEGGKVEKLLSIHVSNIAHVDPATGKATKVGVKVLEDGSRVRFYKSSGQVFN